ncbi:hypothetical protein MNBD_NITROSPINAE04-729 [hydrothermal vent metagenome]|uniref:Translation initiation factor IF-2 N-terminal domain-containing protein n=1 Tax=hydrothermal vent metagenome TaxID=652676 RepID=A0A3B1C8I9_9ZZZZ
MDKIRVYEAAKKLNIKTKELINLLLSKGIAVKSPISFISQRDFESLLNQMTAPGKNVKTKPGKAKKKKRAVKAVKSVSAPKKKKSKLSLVPPLPSDEVENPESVEESSTPEPEKKIGKKAAPEKKKHKLPRKHEPVKPGSPAPAPVPVVPAPVAAPGKSQSSALSYLSFAMAAIALFVTLGLSSNVANNTSSVSQINQTVSQTANALKAELAGVNDGIRINQDLIFENRDSIANALRTQTRIDLSKQSAALKELAPSLPAKISTRILDISKGMNSLASSL